MVEDISKLDLLEPEDEDEDNNVIIFENPSYETAFLGVTIDGIAVYDMELMIQYLVDKDGMTPEEALEFIDYNTVRACMYYSKAPIIMNRMTLEEVENLYEA